ncbi:MAG: nucleotidyl transferase AbiEii/AbiGii toxin family protein [Candidatus Aminicenantaceae bacterium]
MGLEILDNIQRRILTSVCKISGLDFIYLTGGTALSAFYLYHRKSHDLDFFTAEEELIPSICHKIEDQLKKEGFEVEKTRGLRSFTELLISLPDDSTIIHIALDSPYRLEELKQSKDYEGLKVDSLRDIAANKLLTVFGRANLRDFVDVYFLVKEKFTKKELIEDAIKKDPGFDLYWLGTAMERINEFSDDSAEMLLLVKSCPIDELQKFFNAWRREIFIEVTKG